MTRRAAAFTTTDARVMTPKDIADRWHCSERHVRNIIRQGELRSFRLGQKLVRIPLLNGPKLAISSIFTGDRRHTPQRRR